LKKKQFYHRGKDGLGPKMAAKRKKKQQAPPEKHRAKEGPGRPEKKKLCGKGKGEPASRGTSQANQTVPRKKKRLEIHTPGEKKESG